MAKLKELQFGNTFKGKAGGVKVVTSSEIMESKEPIQEIEIAKIHAPKFHDRKNYSKESIVELAKNIQANKDGKLLQPIVVRVLEDGSIERMIGFRRIEAYKFMGRKKIEAKVLSNISDEEALLIMLSENIQREDPNIYDQTVGILEYIGVALNMGFDDIKKLLYHFRNIDSKTIANPSEEILQKRELIESITNKLGKISVSTLINRLKIFSFNDLVLDALNCGDISFNAGLELNKFKDKEKIKELIAKVKAGELSVSGIKEILKEEKSKSKKPHKELSYDLNADKERVVLSFNEKLNKSQIDKLEKFLRTL